MIALVLFGAALYVLRRELADYPLRRPDGGGPGDRAPRMALEVVLTRSSSVCGAPGHRT